MLFAVPVWIDDAAITIALLIFFVILWIAAEGPGRKEHVPGSDATTAEHVSHTPPVVDRRSEEELRRLREHYRLAEEELERLRRENAGLASAVTGARDALSDTSAGKRKAAQLTRISAKLAQLLEDLLSKLEKDLQLLTHAVTETKEIGKRTLTDAEKTRLIDQLHHQVEHLRAFPEREYKRKVEKVDSHLKRFIAALDTIPDEIDKAIVNALRAQADHYQQRLNTVKAFFTP